MVSLAGDCGFMDGFKLCFRFRHCRLPGKFAMCTVLSKSGLGSAIEQ